MLRAATGDSPREGAAAPRVLIDLEGLGGQEGRGHLNARRAYETADREGEADRSRGAGRPTELLDEWATFREGCK